MTRRHVLAANLFTGCLCAAVLCSRLPPGPRLGAKVELCHRDHSRTSFSLLTASVAGWEDDHSQHDHDCCLAIHGSSWAAGAYASKSCERSHVACNPELGTCGCMKGLTFNPDTHACEGTSPGLAPTLPALLRSRSVHARSLLLQSNPTCPAGCAEQQCVPESTSGGVRCALCRGTLLVDRETGACVCPPGHYGTIDSCASCPKGSYCHGGTYTGPNTPVRTPCGEGLTTLGRRAMSRTLCVNKPGYFYQLESDGTPRANPCPPDHYCPGLRKQRAPAPCFPGYSTGGLTAMSSISACGVPAGYYLKDPGQVAPCPNGEYRALQDDEQTCLPCAAGVSTPDIASPSAPSCKVLLPSYYAAAMQDGVITSTARCIQGYFCIGGEPTAAYNPNQPDQLTDTTVQECPQHSWTQGLGASASSLCMTPPGFKTSGSDTTECESGTYRSEWRPPGYAHACLPCGDGIESARSDNITQFDPVTGAPSQLGVRGSPACCFIKPGCGMLYSAATNTFRAVSCDHNTYGTPTTLYGLVTYPCYECPAGMHTNLSLNNSSAYFVQHADGSQGFTSIKACVTRAGYGFDGERGTKCPVGWWNEPGNYESCKQCPPNLITADAASEQTSEADCNIVVCLGSPAPPAHGSFECGSLTVHGSTCTAVCEEGWTAGQVTATCGVDGNWTNTGQTTCHRLVVECSSNTVCPDVSQCCLYNGTTAGPVSFGTCGVTAAACDANGLALSGPSVWHADQDCGGGVRGSGVCANGAGCCSPLGYCGTGTACSASAYANAQFPDGFVMLTHTNMTATASSSWGNIAGLPSRAVDGNTNPNYYDGSCYHSRNTVTNVKEWLLIDMHASRQVAGMRVSNRWDAGLASNRPLEIRVGDATTAPASNAAIDLLPLCRQDTDSSRPGTLVYQVLCSQILIGRYIAIRVICYNCYLMVCEVQPFVHL